MADKSHSDEAGMTALLQNAPRLKPSPDLWLRIANDAALTPVLAQPQIEPMTTATSKHAGDGTHMLPKRQSDRHPANPQGFDGQGFDGQDPILQETPWYEKGFALAASLAFAAALVTLPWLTSKTEPQMTPALAVAADTGLALPFDEDTADETLAWLAGLGDFGQAVAIEAGTPVDTNDFNDLNDIAPEIRTFASLGNLGLNTLVYAQE